MMTEHAERIEEATKPRPPALTLKPPYVAS